MNLVGVYICSNFKMDLKSTIVTQSLKVSSPIIIEFNFWYFCSYTASSDATVSILQRQAERRSISQLDNVRILVMSFASRTKSIRK